MAELTPATAGVLQALRENHEGGEIVDDQGRVWNTVYLDNAQPRGMSNHAWAGHLSALERAGFYRPLDQVFGDVRMND